MLRRIVLGCIVLVLIVLRRIVSGRIVLGRFMRGTCAASLPWVVFCPVRCSPVLGTGVLRCMAAILAALRLFRVRLLADILLLPAVIRADIRIALQRLTVVCARIGLVLQLLTVVCVRIGLVLQMLTNVYARIGLALRLLTVICVQIRSILRCRILNGIFLLFGSVSAIYVSHPLR